MDVTDLHFVKGDLYVHNHNIRVSIHPVKIANKASTYLSSSSQSTCVSIDVYFVGGLDCFQKNLSVDLHEKNPESTEKRNSLASSREIETHKKDFSLLQQTSEQTTALDPTNPSFKDWKCLFGEQEKEEKTRRKPDRRRFLPRWQGAVRLKKDCASFCVSVPFAQPWKLSKHHLRICLSVSLLAICLSLNRNSVHDAVDDIWQCLQKSRGKREKDQEETRKKSKKGEERGGSRQKRRKGEKLKKRRGRAKKEKRQTNERATQVYVHPKSAVPGETSPPPRLLHSAADKTLENRIHSFRSFCELQHKPA